MNSSITTNSPSNFKDKYLYATKKYYKVMEKYRLLFSSLFRQPVLTFGYVRYLKNGDALCLDSSPELVEMLCGSGAIEDAPTHTCFDKVNSGNNFIYANYDINNVKHNSFRIALEKKLHVKQSFLITEKYTDYYHIIPFSFGCVDKAMSLLEQQNIILMDCVSKAKGIKACFDQFRTEMFNILEDKSMYQTNLKDIKKDSYNTQEFVTDNNNNDVRKVLLKAGIIENKDLMLQHVKFTPQEKKVLDYYLQGMSAKEIGQKIQRSYKTIEEHINMIKARLNVKKK